MKERLSLAALAVTLVACCCPPPAFVGIPDSYKRSDMALPLAGEQREGLVDFLQVGSKPPRNFRREDTDARRATVLRYRDVLDQLAVPVDQRMFKHLTPEFALKPGTPLPKPEGVFPRLMAEAA